MYECNANANPKEQQFWSQEIEIINIRTMSNRLTEDESFASRLLDANLELGFLFEFALVSAPVLA